MYSGIYDWHVIYIIEEKLLRICFPNCKTTKTCSRCKGYEENNLEKQPSFILTTDEEPFIEVWI